ncbi:restriction endonuclease subunit S [Microcoleus sp. herbarium2]|uniref:restriction endonuclease subunit S n=1 Tax=Microcoleus sp. herbarium2 TaxID=3055433 RepID=UPI002FD35FE9
MITSWNLCTIQDLQNKGEAKLKTGPFGTQLHASDYVETGTPVINVRNIGFGEIREEKLEFISEQTVQRLSSHLLEPGDIVFGRKGAVERHAFINPKYARWFQGSDCLRLRVKSASIDSRFLSYYFLTENHKQWMINQCSHGATMATLNQAIISRIPLLIPPIHTQRKIVSILSAYDDRLIENNTRRIEILEEMARSIYREWFVKFRFPGHEQVQMVDSELGLIPQG